MNSQVLQDEKWLLMAGIYDAIDMGSAKLPLDPFLEIDGIVIPTNDFNSTPNFQKRTIQT